MFFLTYGKKKKKTGKHLLVKIDNLRYICILLDLFIYLFIYFKIADTLLNWWTVPLFTLDCRVNYQKNKPRDQNKSVNKKINAGRHKKPC